MRKLSHTYGRVNIESPFLKRKVYNVHKSAKHIDIKNQSVVLPWVIDCVQRHYKRHDFRDMLIKHGMKKADYYRAKREHDKYAFVPYCKNIS